jgi:hypothetical protein
MPSLHTAWAILIFLAALPMGPWWRTLATLFLVGTVGATLALGEHFVVDLIVAVPFVVVVEGIAANPFAPARRRQAVHAIVGGVLMVVLWLAAIRFGAAALQGLPVVPWLMTLATLAGSVVMLARLLRPHSRPVVAPSHRAVASGSLVAAN